MEKAREEGTTKTGFLIDGYPREKDQGILFEQNVKLSFLLFCCLFFYSSQNIDVVQVCPVDLILFFDVANETLKKRLLGRAAVSQRADDNEETIKKRIEIFNSKNNEIVEHYKDKVVRVSCSSYSSPLFLLLIAYFIGLRQLFYLRSMQKEQWMKFSLK